MHGSISPRNGRRSRARRLEAGVPKEIRFRTRHELALEMLDDRDRCCRTVGRRRRRNGPSSRFRRDCGAASSVIFWRSPRTRWSRPGRAGTAVSGRGRRPKSIDGVDRWRRPCPKRVGRSRCRDGEKGPLIVEVVKCRCRRGRRRAGGAGEVLFMTREASGRHVQARLLFVERRLRRRIEGVRAVSKAAIGSRNASSARRARRGWPTTR